MIIDKLLELGNSILSKETGFIHYNYKSDIENAKSIPLYENTCFCLVLYRSKKIENIEKANKLLKKLLPFFSKDEGFPIYVHQYPICEFYHINLEMLFVLYWIEKEAKKILPQELKEELHQINLELLKICAKQKKHFAPSAQLRFQAIKSKINDEAFDLENHFQSSYFYKKQDILNVLLALQVYDLDNKKSSFAKMIWQEVFSLHNQQLGIYPALYGVFQEKYEEKKDLLDWIFLFYFRNLDLKNLDFDGSGKDAKILSLALIRPIINTEKDINKHSNKKNLPTICRSEHFCFIYKNKDSFDGEVKRKGSHIFRLIFGNENERHSLVLENFSGETKTTVDENCFETLFTYDAQPMLDDFEIKLFVEKKKDINFLVNGHKATFFDLEDTITILSLEQKIDISFELISPLKSNLFTGHILRKNRLSQVAYLKDKTKAFDYLIGIRSIKREPRSQLLIKCNFTNIAGKKK